MMELKALICAQCGGQLDPVTYKCPYCGTAHKLIHDNGAYNLVVIKTGPAEVLKAETRLDYSDLNRMPEEALASLVADKLFHSLANGIKPFIELEAADDYMTGGKVFRARLLVVPPGRRIN